MFLKWGSLLIAAACLCGCAAETKLDSGSSAVRVAQSLPPPDSPVSAVDVAPYRIAPGDEISIAVFGAQELDKTATVDAAGGFSLPLAGTVTAAGKTPEELSDAIAAKLRGPYLKNPRVAVNGAPLRLQPGGGSGGGRGFFAWIDASQLTARPIGVRYEFGLRGNSSLTYAPQAGETSWRVKSSWPNPSFGGDFLPEQRKVDTKGFEAAYRIGNLALGKSLASTGDVGQSNIVEKVPPVTTSAYAGPRDAAVPQVASISLIQPVDLYSQVNRATKYGFLFIGFTFLALLMFDVIGGVKVSAVEYLLMGAAIVLFFVLLLAFAEVIGFTAAYIVASAAIAGLNTAYSAAVLGSWKRAWFIGGLLVGLYAVLYILLSLEAFSLLIGSLLLFAALAGVMYGTRRIDWGAPRQTTVE